MSAKYFEVYTIILRGAVFSWTHYWMGGPETQTPSSCSANGRPGQWATRKIEEIILLVVGTILFAVLTYNVYRFSRMKILNAVNTSSSSSS